MHYLLLSSVAIGQTFVRAVAIVNKPVNAEGRKEGNVVAGAIKTPLHYT